MAHLDGFWNKLVAIWFQGRLSGLKGMIDCAMRHCQGFLFVAGGDIGNDIEARADSNCLCEATAWLLVFVPSLPYLRSSHFHYTEIIVNLIYAYNCDMNTPCFNLKKSSCICFSARVGGGGRTE